MNAINRPAESDGAPERQAQKDLTERVGAPLVRRSGADNRKWSTWASRLTPRRKVRT
jgi:hypothetical protein